ncbi:MAG: hypothetical protein E7623_06900 [Ruminococcaceae bacterium]|nr:hypothetical protein [Oscillospiraceae bacterium]
MNEYSYGAVLSEDLFDDHGNIVPKEVLKLFQKAADGHAAILGVDFDSMLKKGFLWVVTLIKYEVCKKALPGDSVKVNTWPLIPNRIGFQREYLISDESGATLIKGTSSWMLIDAKERKLAPTKNVYPEMEHKTEKSFEDRIKRLRDFEHTGEPFKICPDESHIDRNGHVNNTNYAEFALSSIGGLKGSLKSFQADYIHEILCGEPVDFYSSAEGDTIQIKGMSEEKGRMFSCEITYGESI